MADREKQKIVTKKHMARQEREERQTRIIIYGSVLLIVVVAILVGLAVVDTFIITPNKPVATVNGEKISAKDYETRVKLERAQMVTQFINTANFMQSFQDDATASYFQSSLQQISFQMVPAIHGQNVLDTMIEDVLIQQEADRRGITVSKAEVDEYVAEIFSYYPEGTPTTAPTSEPVPTSTLSPQQLTLVPPTPTAVVTQTTEVEPTPTEEIATEPTEALPTPTVYTEEAFQENYNQLIESNKTAGISEADFREILRADILRNKMMDEVTKDLPREEEQVWARHILVDTEEEAQAVLARLDAGEDFAALAIELSKDTGSGMNGGDLGWFGHGQMVAPFESAAFALEIGDISEPVQSDFGWHIIQKLGHETRPVDDATYEQMKQTAFTEWLDNERANADIESDDTWMSVYPETPNIPAQYLALIGQ